MKAGSIILFIFLLLFYYALFTTRRDIKWYYRATRIQLKRVFRTIKSKFQ